MTLTAHVQAGRLVLDEPIDLPEGTAVELQIVDIDDDLADEERAALDASIDRGLDEMERGGGVAAEEVLAELERSS